MRNIWCRQPNLEEQIIIRKFFSKKFSSFHYTEKDAEQLSQDYLDSYYFIVLDDYISDCPGFAGRILFAVYGFPETFEVFKFKDDELVEIIPQKHTEK